MRSARHRYSSCDQQHRQNSLSALNLAVIRLQQRAQQDCVCKKSAFLARNQGKYFVSPREFGTLLMKLRHMKKVIVFFGLVAFFSSAYSTTTLTSTSKIPLKADEVYLPVGKTGRLISLMDLSRVSVKEFETLSGKKMKLLDKVNFKLGQRELKKSINPDGSFNKKSIERYLAKPVGPGGGFSLVGLLLGLFLSLIGVLIAYVIAGSGNRSRVTWAWIGAAISFVVCCSIIIF